MTTGSDHPFTSSLSDLSGDELDKKHSELMNKFRMARSMNMDQAVLHQIDLLLNSIESEKIKRQNLDDQPDGVIIDTDPITIQRFDPNK